MATMRIIKGVRLYPQLYDPNFTPAERQVFWMKLSKRLKMDAKFIRTRWYVLREAYIRQLQNELEGKVNDGFAGSLYYYFQEMEFLLPYIRLQLKSHDESILPENFIEPEFIITENDLKADNDVFEHDFIELEPELEDDDDAEDVIIIEEAPPEIINISEKSVHEKLIDDFSRPTNGENQMKVHYYQIHRNEQEEKYNNIKTKNSPNSTKLRIVRVEEGVQESAKTFAAPQKRRSDEQIDMLKRIKKERRESGSISGDDENRCEDVIFGELVSATLKNMPLEKKRMKKKEIMNLLFA